MAFRYRTKGFIFKKEDRSEADRLFSVFTEDFGRVEVLGKGIRKINSKLRGGIEIFSFSEIEFIQGKNRKTLTDATTLDKFYGVGNSEKLKVGYHISRVLSHFIRGEEQDKKILDLVKNTFSELNKTESYFLLYYYFFWNFIAALGHAPELSNCASCHQKLKPHNLYFSNKDGGVICKNCAALKKEMEIISIDTIKLLRLILGNKWRDIIEIENKKRNSGIIEISFKKLL